MAALQLVPVIFSLLVLGAHFLRAGNLAVVAVIVAVLGVAFIRRPWAARLTQSALVFGTLVWCRTLMVLVMERQQRGQPAARMALILGAVVLITLLATLLIQIGPLRRRYRIGDG